LAEKEKPKIFIKKKKKKKKTTKKKVYFTGVFNLCQHFEISYSRYANKHYITGVYIAINDIYRQVNLEMQVSKVKFII
jgi:hypothetical protein